MEIERRCLTAEEAPECEIVIETRASGREAIRGLAIPYNRLSLDLGGFRERILPGSFDKIIPSAKATTRAARLKAAGPSCTER